MFGWWLHLVFLYLAVLLPVGSARRMRAYAAHPPAPGETPSQLRIYPQIIAWQWILAGLVVWAIWRMGIPPAALGLRAPRWALLAGCAVLLAAAWVPWEWRLRRAVREPVHRARLLNRFHGVRSFLPTTDAQFRWWIAVSITAGVCEEVLYRGFMAFYLERWMPLWAAALVGSVVFGFAHLYQGRRGMLRTGLVGAIFWAVYVATGSVLPGMLLHAAIDVRSGAALRAALEREAAETTSAPPGPPEAPGAAAG